MPGVPSGRGCNACRKQKKKCDQGKPACGRCTRLKITCIGAGQQRYKFVQQGSLKPQESSTCRAVILEPPHSATDGLAARFCQILNDRDARFDLRTYGEFMPEMPKRLGRSPALDASVTAVTDAFVMKRANVNRAESYDSYSRALKALYTSLMAPSATAPIDILSAIYLIVVCQGWLGTRTDCGGHGQALIHFLRIVANGRPLTAFERQMTVTACVVVIMESMGNQEIKLGPWFKDLTAQHDQNIAITSLRLRNLAKFPCYLQNPVQHLPDMKLSYDTVLLEAPRLRKTVAKLSLVKYQVGALHSQCQTAHGMLLGQALLLNTLLHSFDTSPSVALSQEATDLADEIIQLARDASIYRPFGSSAIAPCLITAWIARVSNEQKRDAWQLLEEYQSDSSVARWTDMAANLDRRLNGSPWDGSLKQPGGSTAPCAVM